MIIYYNSDVIFKSTYYFTSKTLIHSIQFNSSEDHWEGISSRTWTKISFIRILFAEPREKRSCTENTDLPYYDCISFLIIFQFNILKRSFVKLCFIYDQHWSIQSHRRTRKATKHKIVTLTVQCIYSKFCDYYHIITTEGTLHWKTNFHVTQVTPSHSHH